MISRRNMILGFGAVAGAVAVGQHRVTLSRPGTAFGTTVNLEVTARTSSLAEAALDTGYAAIRAVHKAASLFDPKSEVSRLNGAGRLKNPSLVLREIIRISGELHHKTDGAFDPTVQPLWKLWSATKPSEQALREVVASIGWKKLQSKNSTLELTQRAALTFNGIAQGYAADLVMAAMKREGALAARIDTGEAGRFNASGGLAIQHPRKSEALGYLKVSDGFVAVSGDYASAFSDDFQHHHIFDPKLGYSPLELASVAVIAPTGAYADGLATAFMVMGAAASLKCLRTFEGCSALFVDKAGAVTMSDGMSELFTTLAA